MVPPTQRLGNGTCLVECLCQVLGTLLMRNIPIGRMVHEEFLLVFQCRGHRFLRIDILLAPIHDTNEPEFERICPSGQDIISVCSCIHEVKLGEDPDGPTALGIHGTSKLQ